MNEVLLLVFLGCFAASGRAEGEEKTCDAFGLLRGNATRCCVVSGPGADVVCNEADDEAPIATIAAAVGSSCPIAITTRTFPLFGSSYQTRQEVRIDQSSNGRQLVEQQFCDDDFCLGFGGVCRQIQSSVEVRALASNGTTETKAVFVAAACRCVAAKVGGVSPAYKTKTMGSVLTEYAGCLGVGVDKTKPCVFPFVYNGRRHDRCTYIDDGRPWCAIDTDANGFLVDDSFGYCTSDCPVNTLGCRTVPPGPVVNAYCAFPFRYKGVQYHKCSLADDTEPWCATHVDRHGNFVHGRWGRCSCNGIASTAATTTPTGTSTMTTGTTTPPTTPDCEELCAGGEDIPLPPDPYAGRNPCFLYGVGVEAVLADAGRRRRRRRKRQATDSPEACQRSCSESAFPIFCKLFRHRVRICSSFLVTPLRLFPEAGSVSGPRTCVRSSCYRCFLVFPGAVVVGGGPAPARTVAECQARCLSTNGCHRFVYADPAETPVGSPFPISPGDCVLQGSQTAPPLLVFGVTTGPRCCCGAIPRRTS